MNSKWTKCISQSGTLRGVALQATELARELAGLHEVQGQAAQLFAEAIVGAGMIASYCKPGERVNLNIRGTGVIQQALVDADPHGHLRAFVSVRDVQMDSPELHQGWGPWGEGLLSVLRSKAGEGEQPYIGTVPLATGHLPKDLTYYWLQSEQLPSAVGIHVQMGANGKIESAGGFLVQVMPGAQEAEISAVEKNLSQLGKLAQLMPSSEDPVQLLSQVFQDSTFMVLEEKALIAQCGCSRDRVLRALTLVGVAELQSLLEERDGAEVKCDFCVKTYRVSGDELRTMISSHAK